MSRYADPTITTHEQYLASIRREGTTSEDTHPLPERPDVTVRTTSQHGVVERRQLYVGGWRTGTYKTSNGLDRALERLRAES